MSQIEHRSAALQHELADDRTNRREAMLGWMEEIAPYGIFTTDAELNIRSWNRWLATHSGIAARSVIGRRLFEVFPDIRERRLDDHFRRALSGEIALLSTALHRYLLPLPPARRDFDVSHMLQNARIAPLPSGGEIVGTISIIEDVTQRECQALILRRQQEHDRLLSTSLALLLESARPLEAAAELFPRIAAPLKLEAYFNFLIGPSATEMRLHAAGGIPPDVRRMLATTDINGPSAFSRCAFLKKPLNISHVQSTTEPHTEFIRKLGLRAYVGFPLLVGDRLLGTLSFGSYARDVIAAEDVSFLSTLSQYIAVAIERAFREQALHEAKVSLSQHAEGLETKIAERTAKLHETIQQLESFSYTIAHDLRAPIRSLNGYTDVMLSDYAESVPPEGQQVLRRLQRASNRLDALTRDLLKFSKIVRADVELAPVDLVELVDDIVLVSPGLQGDVLTVHPPLGRVWAQRTLLQQCLSNLFDNALKFAKPGGPARIRVRTEVLEATASAVVEPRTSHPFNPPTSDTPLRAAAPPAEGTARLRIWIEDEGIGIPEGSHERIFGIFERVTGVERIEGTGIGLAIVARAMQQMGGSCGVESQLGRGARFWLELASA
jgi:PAS domain S-box-containing protein